MKILVVGAGALGCFVGGLLSKDNEVAVLCKKEQYAALKKTGIRISGKTNYHARPEIVKNAAALNGRAFEAVFLAVKSYDTEAALGQVLPRINGDSAVLTLQNGLDAANIISRLASADRIIDGATSHGITYIGTGAVCHKGFGETRIGILAGGGPAQKMREKTHAALNKAGIKTEITNNPQGERWAKAIVNASINPITAIAGVENGEILKRPILRALLKDTCGEASSVAKACGVRLPRGSMLKKALGIARNTAHNRSSMLQDMEKGKRTEIDSINGAIAAYAKQHSMEAPINEALAVIIKGFELKKQRRALARVAVINR